MNSRTPCSHLIMRAEVVADCYSGDTCDQVVNKFKVYCDGDRDSDTITEDLVIALASLPAGAFVTVTYPVCPECGTPREDEYEHTDGGLRQTGHKAKCGCCGFDWQEWVLGQYS